MGIFISPQILSIRPQQSIAKAMICGVEGPCVFAEEQTSNFSTNEKLANVTVDPYPFTDFDLGDTTKKKGAPFLAYFARSGHDAACSEGVELARNLTIQTALPLMKRYGSRQVSKNLKICHTVAVKLAKNLKTCHSEARFIGRGICFFSTAAIPRRFNRKRF